MFLLFILNSDNSETIDNNPETIDNNPETIDNNPETIDNNPETADSSPETTGSGLTASGGNPDVAVYIEVTVSENKYFYQNHEISYEDLIKVFDELNENTVVKINDENAALRAYESLTKALEERGILFEEVK